MNSNLENWIKDFEYGKEQTHKNLTFIPITTSKTCDFDFLTLKSALQDGLAEVKELENGASVPEVRVINRSDKHLIIFDGEHLIGAKQNRIVNKTIVINPFSEIDIPVSCTEEGRWHDVSEEFTKSDYNAPSSVRKAAKKKGDSQSEVWEHVDSVLYYIKKKSPTSSLNEVYEDVGPKFDDYKQNVKPLDTQIGFFAFINGAFAGLDIIGDRKVFNDLYESLINSYLLEAFTNSGHDTPDTNFDSLKNQLIVELDKAKITRGENIGAEKREEIKTAESIGELVSFNGDPIHFALFANTDNSDTKVN